MIVRVASECVKLGLWAGAVAARGIRVAESGVALRGEIAGEVAALRARFADAQAVRSLPEVAQFQDILRRAGVNPRRLQPSVERLLLSALKRGQLPAVNNLVDAYNLVSVRTLCSLGAHDLDRIALPVQLRPLTGQETFTPLGSDRPEPVVAGEFGYVDAAGRLLCRLDVLQADFSKVTSETVNALVIVEGTTAHAPESIRRAFAEVLEAIPRHCGGTAEVVALPEPTEVRNGDNAVAR
jgi:DNA/RNA-binding domain of Phe-tRNA-synthetase-like protein